MHHWTNECAFRLDVYCFLWHGTLAVIISRVEHTVASFIMYCPILLSAVPKAHSAILHVIILSVVTKVYIDVLHMIVCLSYFTWLQDLSILFLLPVLCFLYWHPSGKWSKQSYSYAIRNTISLHAACHNKLFICLGHVQIIISKFHTDKCDILNLTKCIWARRWKHNNLAFSKTLKCKTMQLQGFFCI